MWGPRNENDGFGNISSRRFAQTHRSSYSVRHPRCRESQLRKSSEGREGHLECFTVRVFFLIEVISVFFLAPRVLSCAPGEPWFLSHRWKSTCFLSSFLRHLIPKRPKTYVTAVCFFLCCTYISCGKLRSPFEYTPGRCSSLTSIQILSQNSKTAGNKYY